MNEALEKLKEKAAKKEKPPKEEPKENPKKTAAKKTTKPAKEPDSKKKKKTKSKPTAERFEELLTEITKFLKEDSFCQMKGLRLITKPREEGQTYLVVGKSARNDIWAILRRGKGWYTCNRGSLLKRLRRNPKLRPFFLS